MDLLGVTLFRGRSCDLSGVCPLAHLRLPPLVWCHSSDFQTLSFPWERVNVYPSWLCCFCVTFNADIACTQTHDHSSKGAVQGDSTNLES
eukprot:5330155-Amphidinium_carterae.1